MDIKAIHQEIKDFCESNQNPEIVKKYSRYFKEGYQGYGLEKGLLEGKIQEILDREQPLMKEVQELSLLLIPEQAYELPSAAMHSFMKMKKHYSRESFLTIARWPDIGITNWAHADWICMELLKEHLKKKYLDVSDLEPWRFSDRPYKRRISLVAMIYVMKAGHPPGNILEYTAPLMQDTERVVHQGAGWLLRETWKKHPTEVEVFLLKWKDTAPRLIFQYATEKMSKEDKERFRKSK